MLRGIARLAIAAPRRILAGALLILICAAVFGAPVSKTLSAGGFLDPNAQSTRANQVLSEKFQQGDIDVLLTLSSADGARDDTVRTASTEIVEQLKRIPIVAKVNSPWTVPPDAASTLISRDGKTALIVVGVTGSDREYTAHAQTVADAVVHDRDGVTVRGGGALTYVDTNKQTRQDLGAMEFIAIPVSFLVLIWVFGGLTAAAIPLGVGIFAIAGALAALRALTFFTDVSIFALNLAAALGLALAIDYTLLIVSRYRDELVDGVDRDVALVRTMVTAGRTVLFSATTVALSMLAMVAFPMYFLKSFAYAGTAVIVFAAVAALLVTPAVIVVVGDRLNSFDVRRPLRRIFGRPDPAPRPVEQAFWYRSTKFVTSHALAVGLGVTALLVVLGAPFLGVKWGVPDDRVLPPSAQSRQVGDQLRAEFAVDPTTSITVVIPDAAGAGAGELARYAGDLSRVPDVPSVSSPAGTFVNGARVGPPSAPAGFSEGVSFMTIGSTAPLFSDASETQLDRIHAVATPSGQPVLVGGLAQVNRDSVHAVMSPLPLVFGLIAVVTFILLFLLTGSVVLPLKALLLNLLSLTAAFGALVWIFQEGHWGGLGVTVTGTLAVNVPVLLFCIAFGLSMDYEVFIISRIREYWLASGRTPADNDESVALGLARTGRVVTAAALVMTVSFAALIASQVSFLRIFGFGLTVAVLMDATLVRLMLVPAFMHWLGRANWWAPKPLARLHGRIGFSESSGEISASSVDRVQR
jgi:putative drug exporter of the RND superfamily